MKTARSIGLTISALASELKAYADSLAFDYDPADISDDDGAACGDVRLQIVDGSWTLHAGDASFDQDHRGAWGAASVNAGASMRECRDVARDLISEAMDDMAQSM